MRVRCLALYHDVHTRKKIHTYTNVCMSTMHITIYAYLCPCIYIYIYINVHTHAQGLRLHLARDDVTVSCIRDILDLCLKACAISQQLAGALCRYAHISNPVRLVHSMREPVLRGFRVLQGWIRSNGSRVLGFSEVVA